MKLKNNFVLQEIADEYIVVPVGDVADKLSGILKLNKTGAFLWGLLSAKDITEEELISAICDEYKIQDNIAESDIYSFIKNVQRLGCFES